ncbi:MAG TPA: FAD-dependent monooxygenase [Candidatus Dormibacteraeota bacterium]|nr:FAD-dependent monooxygenase [Candidatus Dormibacteraeota bacterium]
MRIGIVGGGPAGLYFALLMKRLDSSHEIRVVEQNPAGGTFGFGVVFSDRALSFLQDADPDSYADLDRRWQTWDDQVIVHRNERVRIDGIGFSGIARLELLQVLQDHYRRRGVGLEFERRLPDLAAFADCDLVVGADGVNSVIREAYRDPLDPSIGSLSNRYVWYGTTELFDTLTLTFRENADGVFVAHHYRHAPHCSTFVVECDAATWEQTGLASLSEDESRRYCEAVFAADLRGHPLLTNRSLWITFKVVTNRRWSHDNVVLIGDALRTVHFSIGSGTRNALEDAIALFRAFETHGADVPAALQAFEEARRPGVDKFLNVAERSYAWYERFREKMQLDPLPFAYDYVMRGGRISHERLKKRSPGFVAAYEARMASRPAAPPAG